MSYMNFQEHPLRPTPMFPDRPPMGGTPAAKLDPKWDPGFQAFAHVLNDAKIAIHLRTPSEVPLSQRNWYSDDKSNDTTQPRVFLMNAYKSGGTSGNGGGESSTAYTYPKDELPEFSDWTKTLLMFWPDIPYIKEKLLRRAVLTSVSWSTNEYYGDSSAYNSEMVDLEKLYAILKHENKLVPVPGSNEWAEDFSNLLGDLKANPLVTLNEEDRSPAPQPKNKIK